MKHLILLKEFPKAKFRESVILLLIWALIHVNQIKLFVEQLCCLMALAVEFVLLYLPQQHMLMLPKKQEQI